MFLTKNQFSLVGFAIKNNKNIMEMYNRKMIELITGFFYENILKKLEASSDIEKIKSELCSHVKHFYETNSDNFSIEKTEVLKYIDVSVLYYQNKLMQEFLLRK